MHLSQATRFDPNRPIASNFLTAAQTSSHDLRALFRYWDDLRAGRSMPVKDDLELASIATLLPLVALIEIEPEPEPGPEPEPESESGAMRFRFAFAGHAISTAYGRDLTGQYSDTIALVSGFSGFSEFSGTRGDSLAIADKIILTSVAKTGQAAAGRDIHHRRIGPGSDHTEITRDWIALPVAQRVSSKLRTPAMILLGQKWKAIHQLVM